VTDLPYDQSATSATVRSALAPAERIAKVRPPCDLGSGGVVCRKPLRSTMSWQLSFEDIFANGIAATARRGVTFYAGVATDNPQLLGRAIAQLTECGLWPSVMRAVIRHDLVASSKIRRYLQEVYVRFGSTIRQEVGCDLTLPTALHRLPRPCVSIVEIAPRTGGGAPMDFPGVLTEPSEKVMR
jgi:hypothetical protein